MNELANVNNAIAIDGADFIGNLTSRTTMFCSMKAETAEQKAAFFNAMNNPEKRLGDCINSIINAFQSTPPVWGATRYYRYYSVP